MKLEKPVLFYATTTQCEQGYVEWVGATIHHPEFFICHPIDLNEIKNKITGRKLVLVDSYLIAYATIKKVTDSEVLTKEWPHMQKRGGFFPDVREGQRWKITYNGSNPWTGIASAERVP